MIVVPAGGGGLLAGVAAAVKQLNPRVKVYGVQAEGADAIARSFREKQLVSTDSAATIADGIAVKSPGDIAFELISKYADGVVTVSDTEIADAMLLLMERCKQIVEPAGATPVAAILNGLVARHRRIKFIVTLLDRPGSLVQMLNIISRAGANILTVEHDKLSAGLNPNETDVHIACEVGGEEHGRLIIDQLKASGYSVELD